MRAHIIKKEENYVKNNVRNFRGGHGKANLNSSGHTNNSGFKNSIEKDSMMPTTGGLHRKEVDLKVTYDDLGN